MEVQGREGGPSASVPGCPQHVIPAGLQDGCLSMPQPVQEGHCPSLTILPPCQVTSKLGDQPESQVSPREDPVVISAGPGTRTACPGSPEQQGTAQETCDAKSRAEGGYC